MIMVKTILYALGIVLVLVGLLGFVNDPVGGIFEVDVLHNIIHLITGAALVIAASLGGKTGTLIVKIFAVVYALVAILGFALPGEKLLGLIEVNTADDILHVVLAALLAYLGFFASKKAQVAVPSEQPPTPPPTTSPGIPSGVSDGGDQTSSSPPSALS